MSCCQRRLGGWENKELLGVARRYVEILTGRNDVVWNAFKYFFVDKGKQFIEFLQIWICDRAYQGRLHTVSDTYAWTMYVNAKTKKRCKKTDNDAIVLHKKGEKRDGTKRYEWFENTKLRIFDRNDIQFAVLAKELRRDYAEALTGYNVLKINGLKLRRLKASPNSKVWNIRRISSINRLEVKLENTWNELSIASGILTDEQLEYSTITSFVVDNALNNWRETSFGRALRQIKKRIELLFEGCCKKDWQGTFQHEDDALTLNARCDIAEKNTRLFYLDFQNRLKNLIVDNFEDLDTIKHLISVVYGGLEDNWQAKVAERKVINLFGAENLQIVDGGTQ